MIRSLELVSRLRATPSHHPVAGMALKRQRHLVAPHHIHHPSLQRGNQCLTTLRLGIVWKYRWSLPKMGNDTTTLTCLAGTSCGRHGPRWQIWPNRSSSDWPRPGHFVLWVAIVRRRTEFGQGKGCLIHLVRSHLLGWQTNPSKCQSGKSGCRLAVDHPSHHQKLHPTKRTWASSLLPICINTIQLQQSRLVSHEWQGLQHPSNDEGCPRRALGHHTRNEAKHCRKTKAKGNKNYGQPHPHYLHLHQIMGLKVISMVSARSDRSGGSRHSHHS